MSHSFAGAIKKMIDLSVSFPYVVLMNLMNLPDRELLKDMARLVKEERELLGRVLWHLKEIDRRKLYSDMKCSSLFDYCLTVLKYSEGQASRRVSACRMLKEMPQIIGKIESGELNLTHLNQAKSFFVQEGISSALDKKVVLEKISGKTTRESERILENLKKVPEEKMIRVEIKVETFEALKDLQKRESHKNPNLDSLVMRMIGECMTIWTPVKGSRSYLDEGKGRYIPLGVKAQVWERDQGKCNNCGSITALQLDHIKPFARGGKSCEENLQLLCRNCNQRKGIVEFGKSGPVFNRPR